MSDPTEPAAATGPVADDTPAGAASLTRGTGRTRGTSVNADDIHRWGPRWSRHVGRLLDHVWWDTEVHGAQNVPADGPVIVASNHTGIVDGPVLHGALPRGSHFLVKQEFFDSRLGFLMTGAGQIPVDRSAGRAALATGKKLLQEGRVVGIFPEGHRGRGDVTSVRAGVAWLALQTGAPILPAACLGTRRSGDPRGYVPRPRAKLHVVFGEPFHLEIPDGVKGRARMAAAMEQIAQRLAENVHHAVNLTGVALPTDPGR